MTFAPPGAEALTPLARRRPRRARRRIVAAPWQLLLIADTSVAAAVALVVPTLEGLAFGATLLALLAAQGCYRARFTSQLGAVVGRLVTTVVIAAAVVAAWTASWVGIALLRLVPIIAIVLIVARGIAGWGVRAMRFRSGGEPTLIVGAGELGARMARNLLDHPEYGLHPIGVVDDDVDDEMVLPLLGTTRELAAVARSFEVRHIVIAFGRADESRMVSVLRTCDTLDANVWVVPRLFEMGATLREADELWGIPVGRLSRSALRTGQWRLKRAFDIVASGSVLVFTLPVTAMIAVLVKLTSRGPVFFRQARIGQGGRIVQVLKFRTMRVNDDSDHTWDVVGDPRVTRIGRILRPTSLDELPQLLNVLRGEMSLVGPRPERPHFVELFSDTVRGYADRHRVPVGLTGLSQVNGLRGDTSIEDRARFDNLYIENWSLWTDLVVLFRTVMAVLHPPKSVQMIDLRDAPAASAPLQAEPATADESTVI